VGYNLNMAMEEKQVRHVLGTPGREEEASVWPPVGQLGFERIKVMSEEELDRAILERHGLSEIFKQGKTGQPYSGQSAFYTAGRLQMKKAALARLEGVGMGSSSPLTDWYAELHEGTEDPQNDLRTRLNQILTDESKHRIRMVGGSTARLSALARLPPEMQKLEKRIASKLESLGQPALTAMQIFSSETPPSHVGEGLRGKVLNVETGLKLYLLKLEGLSNADCASRLHNTEENISSFWTRYFSEEARDAFRLARGMNPLYKPSEG